MSLPMQLLGLTALTLSAGLTTLAAADEGGEESRTYVLELVFSLDDRDPAIESHVEDLYQLDEHGRIVDVTHVTNWAYQGSRSRQLDTATVGKIAELVLTLPPSQADVPPGQKVTVKFEVVGTMQTRTYDRKHLPRVLAHIVEHLGGWRGRLETLVHIEGEVSATGDRGVGLGLPPDVVGGLREKNRAAGMVAEKIGGHGLGFSGVRDPLQHWADQPKGDRWVGKLADRFTWDDVARVHVLSLAMHVRGKGDVEATIRQAIEKAELIRELPADSRIAPDAKGEWPVVQALIVLKPESVREGDVQHDEQVLVTVGSRWTVFEYENRVGLALRTE